MAKTSPGQFMREVRQEVEKVTWPSRRETLMSATTVVIMVFLVALFFFFVDLILSKIVGMILGFGG